MYFIEFLNKYIIIGSHKRRKVSSTVQNTNPDANGYFSDFKQIVRQLPLEVIIILYKITLVTIFRVPDLFPLFEQQHRENEVFISIFKRIISFTNVWIGPGTYFLESCCSKRDEIDPMSHPSIYGRTVKANTEFDLSNWDQLSYNEFQKVRWLVSATSIQFNKLVKFHSTTEKFGYDGYKQVYCHDDKNTFMSSEKFIGYTDFYTLRTVTDDSFRRFANLKDLVINTNIIMASTVQTVEKLKSLEKLSVYTNSWPYLMDDFLIQLLQTRRDLKLDLIVHIGTRYFATTQSSQEFWVKLTKFKYLVSELILENLDRPSYIDLKQLPNLKKLQIECLKGAHLTSSLMESKSVTELCVMGTSRDYLVFVQGTFNQFPELQRLELRNMILKNVSRLPDSIKKLKLQDVRFQFDFAVPTFLNKFELEILDETYKSINNLNSITNLNNVKLVTSNLSAIKPLLDNLPKNLRKLDLNVLKSNIDESMSDINIQNLDCLQELNLTSKSLHTIDIPSVPKSLHKMSIKLTNNKLKVISKISILLYLHHNHTSETSTTSTVGTISYNEKTMYSEFKETKAIIDLRALNFDLIKLIYFKLESENSLVIKCDNIAEASNGIDVSKMTDKNVRFEVSGCTDEEIKGSRLFKRFGPERVFGSLEK